MRPSSETRSPRRPLRPTTAAAVLVAIAIATAPQLAAQAGGKADRGRVSSVTLYRGQAMVTRAIPLAQNRVRSLAALLASGPIWP